MKSGMRGKAAGNGYRCQYYGREEKGSGAAAEGEPGVVCLLFCTNNLAGSPAVRLAAGMRIY